MAQVGISRRELLAGAFAVAVAGCASDGPARDRARSSPTTSTSTQPFGVVASDPSFASLERQHEARLGVFALDTATGNRVEHRADERFAFCSTCKAFVAANVLRRRSVAALDQMVTFGAADLVESSPITSQHVTTGMTVRDMCDAAVRFSDNTAANLLFEQIGGPAGLQAFLRSVGDSVTNCSRIEPALSSAVPGDLRDTTTPRVLGSDLRQVVVGDVLSADRRAILVDWLVHNQTGNGLIRSVVPSGWKVGDKTGNGDYGTRNDMAVLWPPTGSPIVLSVMSSRAAKDDPFDDQLVARAARAALAALR